jgi:tRNA1(Val) A37 N6-methylase TrmN6
MSNLVYNERSWAIDLASNINLYTKTVKRSIARAGGELTLKKKGENSLFPDIILYGDDAASRVRHGWELKLPDTPIDDAELINNATKKAIRFGVNSFLLWNVNEAVLYASEDGTAFTEFHRWAAIGVTTRQQVSEKEAEWRGLLQIILDDLNGFFEGGQLRSASVSDILDESFFVTVLDEYSGLTSDSIKAAGQAKASVNAAIAGWWGNNAAEYGQKPTKPIDYSLLAKVVLTNWLNRFLFSHYLKRFNQQAKAVETIGVETTINQAFEIFTGITEQCNFLQVFRPEIATGFVGDETWSALCEINGFLTGLQLDEVPQEILHEVIEQTLVASKRKAAGQYSTPTNLARLLVALAVENRNGAIIDPCCGTGTIARAAYDLKRSVDIPVSDALGSLWASDKYQFPLQLCTLSLADPEAIGQVTRIFKDDVFDLSENREIGFINPNDGSKVTNQLPKFDTIVSNLPFVRFEDLQKSNPNIAAVLDRNKDFVISGKSDLIAIIVMHLRHLLNANGRLGIVVSNSWLSSDWGDDFKNAIAAEFQIKMIVTSGAGRWFDNADVVTNIIILEKVPRTDNSLTTFVTTSKSIQHWTSEYISDVWTKSLTLEGTLSTENAYFVQYSTNKIAAIGNLVPGWSLLFSDVHWLPELRQFLVSASSLFDVYRGERRGNNELFYPASGHGIETEYIVAVVKSSRDIETYGNATDKEAFCCSKTKQELQALGHNGALAWIAKFDKGGMAKKLRRPNHHWYEMKANESAELVLGMNPAKKIFITHLPEKRFVDQRLIPFSSKDETVDVELCHALLNSLFGLLMIESAGFGRGLGALDLSATKIKEGLFMLDPDQLSEENATNIKQLFSEFKDRAVLPLTEEVNEATRAIFDKAVLEAYGISEFEDRIKSSLLQIHSIRNSVL